MSIPPNYATGSIDTLAAINLYADSFETLLLARLMSAAQSRGNSTFKFFRKEALSATGSQQALMDRFARGHHESYIRATPTTLIFQSENLFGTIWAQGSLERCLLEIRLWSDSAERTDRAVDGLLHEIADIRTTDTGFELHWRFLDSKGEIKAAHTHERVNSPLIKEAYPSIADVEQFISDYLDAPESVLLLQGPPGTGKTRLIRAILAALSTRSNRAAGALYTGDIGALNNDEVYLEFITGSHQAFVVEDADQLLRPRSDGNPILHRFLNIADGIASAQGKKIIFSTNLSNVRDIDPALVRPGRCFALMQIPEMSPSEADALLHRLCELQPSNLQHAQAQLSTTAKKTFSLAEIYRVARRATTHRRTASRYGIQLRSLEVGLGLTTSG